METGEEEGIIVVEVEEARPELDEAAVKMVKVVDKVKIKERNIAQSLIPRQIKCAAAIIPTETKLGTVLRQPPVQWSTRSSLGREVLTSLDRKRKIILLTTRCFPA